jgi:hypothetical protein
MTVTDGQFEIAGYVFGRGCTMRLLTFDDGGNVRVVLGR